MSDRVLLVNPLPEALRHYAGELAATLAAIGIQALPQPGGDAGIEVGGGGVPARLRATARHLAAVRRASRGAEAVLVLWPAFGLLEPLLWRWARVPVLLVVHDAAPLRRQAGYGAVAARLGRPPAGGRVRVVVHGEPARAELERRGWDVAMVLPHPQRPATAAATAADRSASTRGRAREGLRVLGQFKPARDLDVLAALAGVPGTREIVGRGWPPVPGWAVRDEFVPETEFDELLAASEVLVLPYRTFFQSNVAVRALEQRTPLVGPRHPALQELYGVDWPGLVDIGAPAQTWLRAVEAVRGIPARELERLHARAAAGAVEAWRHALADVLAAGGRATP